MIYEDIDPQLLGFLKDPINKVCPVVLAGKPLKWHSKVLYKLPILRRFICADQVQSILWEKLESHLEYARETLPEHIFEDHVPLTKDTVHRFTDELKKYFNIVLASACNEAVSASKKATLTAFIESYSWAVLEYTCNRVAENLQLRAIHNLSILGNSNLWLCYYLSEVYFLIAQGLLVARLSGDTLYIVPTKKLMTRLKTYWLAEIIEADSNISDIFTRHNVVPSLHAHGRLRPELCNVLVDQTLDKCLSIHSNYLSASMREHPKYQYLREIVNIAIHIELRALSGERTTDEAYLKSIASSAAVDMIKSALVGRLPTLSSVSSFVEYKDGVYIRGALNFKYGLRKFVRCLLGAVTINSKAPDFGQLLGSDFERDYIFNYIQDLNDPRLKIHGKFEPGTNAKIKGYDVDLVVQIVEEDIYYFIQAKYQLSEIPTYLSEQCQLFLNENFRTGFVRQLAVLRDNMSDESIRKKLSQHGLSGARPDNSYFVLLHNMPFLNFYESDGIFFYEWNLLRNILRGGRVQVRKGQNIMEEHVLLKSYLHRPQELVEAYFSHSQSGRERAEHYDVYCDAYSHFDFGGLKVVCKLL